MMNKKLIAVAIAAALAAPVVVQAGVEVYGEARMSIDFSSNDDGDGGACDGNLAVTTATECSDSAISVSSNASRLGFRGDEDLGNGLTALWQIEQEVGMDTGTAFTGARDTFVGLSGNFGTVKLGALDTPMTLVSDALDIFGDTRGDFNAVLASAGTVSDQIHYLSPDLNGIRIHAAYVPSYTNDTLAQTQLENDQSAFSLAGAYNNGPIYATLAYESLAEANGTEDYTNILLGGSFDLGQGTKVGAIFQQEDDGSDSWNNWYLNVAHKVNSTTIKAAYGNSDESQSGADDGATQFSIGVEQALSQNTTVYALFTSLSNDPNSEHELYGVGSGVDSGGIADASSFSFGVNHKFSSK